MQAAGCRLLTWDEPQYPPRLREIYDPPPLLYVRGNVELLTRHLISIVGSRRPTPYGNQMAEKLGQDLADRGLVVASGLARGIDACAHSGALEFGKRRHHWGTGLRDRRRLPEGEQEDFRGNANARRHHQRISDGHVSGASKFPDSQPDHCGMALGVVVVEGAQYSGSLITARLAMEFGREVFGVPATPPNRRASAPIS